MEPQAVLNYKVYDGTEAFACINHPIYPTKIYDETGVYYTKQSIHSLLDEACIHGGADYNGRINSVRKKFKYKRLTPLPLDPYYGIYAFPTCSPKTKDCVWVFDSHVHSFKQISNNNIEVTFESGNTLVATISKDFFKEQLENTSLCARHFFKRAYPSKD